MKTLAWLVIPKKSGAKTQCGARGPAVVGTALIQEVTR